MAKIPDETLKFMETYGVRNDEVWNVPGGKAWAVKHSALERVATQLSIEFGLPDVIEKDTANFTVSMIVTARLVTETGEERKTWSIGEVNPSNYRVTGKQPGYPWAMAEKRAKDRCILKLLAAHGALYSDAEADEFVQRDAGPDAAPEQNLTPVNDAMLLQLRTKLAAANANVETFCAYFEVDDVAVFPQSRFDEAMEMLQRKINQSNAGADK